MGVLIYFMLGVLCAFLLGYLEPEKCAEIYEDDLGMAIFLGVVVIGVWPALVGVMLVRAGMEAKKRANPR